MPTYASPNTNNYAILKGEVYFTPDGGTRRHMGNVSSAEFEPALEKLEHFSSMEGTKTKDWAPIIQKSATIKLTLEEITAANIAIAMFGSEGTDTDGNLTIDILAATEIVGRLEVIGTNDLGPKLTFDLPRVSFTPSSALALITEEVASSELTGDVLISNGSFGTITFQDSAGTVL